ncbi:hypothetical protein [Hymenobacter glacieicola]|uniref:Uncharacterized protein n=1 Tax=Hymenobacter glacieicola TaxID=1562124 RepID=A0ABQ1X7J6_9BACT|nr:hypothetical protein [Hymenobacter glacieicola]GGG59867.1 hypothetical protein GCM10011378_39830 [Hymenobacter glacieicola]
MKSAQTFCPARRIPAARLERLRASNAAKRQARQDAAAQLTNPVPEFEAAPRLTLLPGGLHWSAQQPVPAVGATVAVQEPGTNLCHFRQVKGYTHAAGFLGLVTEAAPQGKTSRRKQANPRAGVVFGSQLALAA